MRLRASLLAAALTLGLIETFIVASEPFWIIQFFKPTTPTDINNIVEGFNIASLLVDPALVFLIMFLMGKSMDPAGDFSRTMGSLLLGAVVGTYISLAALAVYAYWQGLFGAFEHQLWLDLLYDAFGAFRLSLVAFAGLAISYLAVRRPQPSPVQP